MPPPSRTAIDPIIAVRGALIALLAFGIGFLPDVQAGAGLSPTTLIAIGIAIQLAIVAARWWARRLEHAHGLAGGFVPVVLQVGTLIADGVTVLLCALAVFDAQLARLDVV